MVHVIRLHLHLFIYEQAIWWISDGHEHMQIQSSIDAQKEKTKSGKMKLPMMRRKDFHKLAKHNSIGNLVFQFDQVHSSLTEVHIIRKWHHNYSLTIAIMIHTDELLKPRFHYVYIYIYPSNHQPLQEVPQPPPGHVQATKKRPNKQLTRVAKRAQRHFPAPNSLLTRVLVANPRPQGK